MIYKESLISKFSKMKGTFCLTLSHSNRTCPFVAEGHCVGALLKQTNKHFVVINSKNATKKTGLTSANHLRRLTGP
jgi:hypothetical protein